MVTHTANGHELSNTRAPGERDLVEVSLFLAPPPLDMALSVTHARKQQERSGEETGSQARKRWWGKPQGTHTQGSTHKRHEHEQRQISRIWGQQCRAREREREREREENERKREKDRGREREEKQTCTRPLPKITTSLHPSISLLARRELAPADYCEGET